MLLLTYLRTYLPTYVPINQTSYVPIYLLMYVTINLLTYLSTYLRTYLPTYLVTYLPTYIVKRKNYADLKWPEMLSGDQIHFQLTMAEGDHTGAEFDAWDVNIWHCQLTNGVKGYLPYL